MQFAHVNEAGVAANRNEKEKLNKVNYYFKENLNKFHSFELSSLCL